MGNISISKSIRMVFYANSKQFGLLRELTEDGHWKSYLQNFIELRNKNSAIKGRVFLLENSGSRSVGEFSIRHFIAYSEGSFFEL